MGRAYAIAILGFALAACQRIDNDGEGSVQEGVDVEASRQADDDAGARLLNITTVEDTLPPGASAEIRLENRSDRIIGFNLCPKVLERQADGSWTELPETRPEACTLEIRILAAGETVVETTGIPIDLEAGSYRIVFEGISFEAGDPAVPLAQRTTNTFEIDGSP